MVLVLLEVPEPLIVNVSLGLVRDVIPPDTAVWILLLRACIPATIVWSAPTSTPPVIAVPILIVEPFKPVKSSFKPSADLDNAESVAASSLRSIVFSSEIVIASPAVSESCLSSTEVCKIQY